MRGFQCLLAFDFGHKAATAAPGEHEERLLAPRRQQKPATIDCFRRRAGNAFDAF